MRVSEVRKSKMLSSIGPLWSSLRLLKTKVFKNDLLAASNIERLNIGPISTMKISWDQPPQRVTCLSFLYKKASSIGDAGDRNFFMELSSSKDPFHQSFLQTGIALDNKLSMAQILERNSGH